MFKISEMDENNPDEVIKEAMNWVTVGFVKTSSLSGFEFAKICRWLNKYIPEEFFPCWIEYFSDNSGSIHIHEVETVAHFDNKSQMTDIFHQMIKFLKANFNEKKDREIKIIVKNIDDKNFEKLQDALEKVFEEDYEKIIKIDCSGGK